MVQKTEIIWDAALRQKVQRMVDRIVERFHPERVILFGSHARGTAGPDSGVDLLVVIPGIRSKRATR
ncbi:MAG TPA: nucleotidyltransferase domain-containing protein [Bdellovibrionota bacterium]|nr:nucleotidyltransferase domain-containing protein [Bdellovibrionota bacterium]